VGVEEAVQEEGVVEGEEEVGNWPGAYLVAIRCTRNGSPRGQLTRFFALQYGQTAIRSTSLASPVDPTTRIPRWQFWQRKIFCTVPPFRNRAAHGSIHASVNLNIRRFRTLIE